MNERVKFLMPNRLKDFYEIGPVQRAAIEDFVEMVQAAEREACAKVCDDMGEDIMRGTYFANAIRAKEST